MTTETTATRPDPWPMILLVCVLLLSALMLVCWIKGLG